MDFRKNHLSEYSLRSKLHTESVTHYNRTDSAITLIALVITIIVLLILAGVSLSLIAGGDGILGKAESAVNATDEAKAKEKLEIVLAGILADKYTDENYNTGNYIDEKIVENEMLVDGDVVTVDGWQFEIDRSKPKIINALGKGQESEEIEIVTNVQYNSTFSQATIKFTINYESDLKSIQINGENQEILKELTKTVDKNGTYQIYVKDENDAYKLAKAEVAELAEDMEIRTAEDLVAFRDKVNKGATFEGKTITLENNITVDNTEQWVPIGNCLEGEQLKFSGVFDGKGHTISGIYINNNLERQGLFGKNIGTIQNLSVEGNITALCRTGGISAYNYGDIKFCTNKINVKTSNVNTGGIVAINCGRIENCINEGEIFSTSYMVGGIAGQCGDNTYEAKVVGCSNIATVTTSGKSGIGNSATAGIVGYAVNTYIESCYNNKKITGIGGTVAGIVGTTDPNITIIQCYNEGEIETTGEDSSGNNNIGGIVGYCTETNIADCYNIAVIKGTTKNIGGVVGNANNSSVKNCYSKGNVTGGTKGLGGVIGYNKEKNTIENCFYLSVQGGISYGEGNTSSNIGTTPSYATPKSLEEFKTLASELNGSNSTKIWKDGEKGYPVFTW